MDYFLKIKDKLEFALYERLKTLFSINVKLTFYDITSSFFYTDNCPIGKNGLSRDNRPDKEQIVIGVVTSHEGYPIKHYVFDGNTKDETTVIEVVRQLKEEYQIEETIFVGDRGMITSLNLDTIEAEGFDYIMGVKHRQSEIHSILFFGDGQLDDSRYENHNDLKIQERYISIRDFLLWKSKKILDANEISITDENISLLMELINTLNNETEVKATEVKRVLSGIITDTSVCNRISTLIKKYHGRYEEKLRTIVCLNETRKKISKQKRKNKIVDLSKALSDLFSKAKSKEEPFKIEKRLDVVFEGYKRRYRKFFDITRDDKTQKAIGYTLNKQAISKEEKYDGIFILSTNRQDLTTVEVVDSYKNLKEVEMLFDDLKHFVDIRPIRHWLEVRVRAHVFLCVLALLLKRIFEINYLKGKSTMHPLEEISTSKLVKYSVQLSDKEDKYCSFPKVTQTTPAQKKIFEMIGIKNPMSLENYIW